MEPEAVEEGEPIDALPLVMAQFGVDGYRELEPVVAV